MKRIKILLCVICISIICFLFLAGCDMQETKEPVFQNQEMELHMDYQVYDTVESISNAAQIIVIGEIIKDNINKEININVGENRYEVPAYFVYTISELKVEKVIKGDVMVGDILEIKQEGGTYNNKTLKVDGIKYLEKGQKGLFFLSGYYDFNIPLDLMNPQQAFVDIVDGKIKSNNSLFNDSISEDDAILEVRKSISEK